MPISFVGAKLNRNPAWAQLWHQIMPMITDILQMTPDYVLRRAVIESVFTG